MSPAELGQAYLATLARAAAELEAGDAERAAETFEALGALAAATPAGVRVFDDAGLARAHALHAHCQRLAAALSGGLDSSLAQAGLGRRAQAAYGR